MQQICKWCARVMIAIKAVWFVCPGCDASPMTGDGPWSSQGDSDG